MLPVQMGELSKLPPELPHHEAGSVTVSTVYRLNNLAFCGSLKLLWPEFQKHQSWASLVAQWLRICLLMQGTRVRALVWENPTCRGATGPVSHNY